jgi:hypothetical protein
VAALHFGALAVGGLATFLLAPNWLVHLGTVNDEVGGTVMAVSAVLAFICLLAASLLAEAGEKLTDVPTKRNVFLRLIFFVSGAALNVGQPFIPLWGMIAIAAVNVGLYLYLMLHITRVEESVQAPAPDAAAEAEPQSEVRAENLDSVIWTPPPESPTSLASPMPPALHVVEDQKAA